MRIIHIRVMAVSIALTLSIGCGRSSSTPTSSVVSSPPSQVAAAPQTLVTSPVANSVPTEHEVDGTEARQLEVPTGELQQAKKDIEVLLQEAKTDLETAEKEYEKLKAEVDADLHSDPEYQAATVEFSELDEKIKVMRANKSPGLAEVSKRRLIAQNKITLWKREFPARLKADQRLVAAEKEIAQLKSLVVDLQKTIEVHMAQAKLERGREAKVIGKVAGTRPPTLSSQHSESSSRQSTSSDSTASDNHSGMVWVPGYTRKNGTHVKGYWRRK